jgi:hypothetical protein
MNWFSLGHWIQTNPKFNKTAEDIQSFIEISSAALCDDIVLAGVVKAAINITCLYCTTVIPIKNWLKNWLQLKSQTLFELLILAGENRSKERDFIAG